MFGRLRYLTYSKDNISDVTYDIHMETEINWNEDFKFLIEIKYEDK